MRAFARSGLDDAGGGHNISRDFARRDPYACAVRAAPAVSRADITYPRLRIVAGPRACGLELRWMMPRGRVPGA